MRASEGGKSIPLLYAEYLHRVKNFKAALKDARAGNLREMKSL